MPNARLKYFFVSLVTLLPCFAQPKREAVRLGGFEYIVPQLILGGEWTSTVKLTNRGRSPIPRTNVDFWDNEGRLMQTTFRDTNGNVVTDSGFSFALNVGSVIDVEFLGGSSTRFGHATVNCYTPECGTPGLYGEVTLRNRNSTRSDFESVFSLESPAPVQHMLFDGRNGLQTTLYVVCSNTTASTVLMDVVDTNNRLIKTVTLSMRPSTSQILVLHALAPETNGIQGTLVFRGQNSTGQFLALTVTGLRINPSNSFTPLRAWIPSL